MIRVITPSFLICLLFTCATTDAQMPGQPTASNPSEPAPQRIATAAGDTFDVHRSTSLASRYEPVVRRLVDRGYPERWVRARFADSRIVYIPKLVKVNPRKKVIGNGEPSSAYRWVNTDESARACAAFIAKYRDILDSASRRYGVEPEMVAALMRTETQHGKVTGDYHVFSVFASTALLTEPDILRQNLDNAAELLKSDSSEIEEQSNYIRARSRKRADWALNELASLMKIERDGKLDAMSIYGSWAGAFGWSQFLPSSYLRRAVDGNGDARVDLFTPADAIHSVANYLKAAGYVRGNNRRVKKALFNYNNSTPYVASIMGLAARVKAAR